MEKWKSGNIKKMFIIKFSVDNSILRYSQIKLAKHNDTTSLSAWQRWKNINWIYYRAFGWSKLVYAHTCFEQILMTKVIKIVRARVQSFH